MKMEPFCQEQTQQEDSCLQVRREPSLELNQVAP